MEFLNRHSVIHGDLAARNILLSRIDSDHIVAKIADFGLSKRLYHTIHNPSNTLTSSVGCAKLPIKWLALEVLMNGQATTKSDVWSYGVLVWEILHLGADPYRQGILKASY